MFNVLLDPLNRVCELYPEEKFRELGLPGYVVPKRHSRLPYVGGVPKGNFHWYETIAKCWMESALLFHYRDLPLPLSSSVILCSDIKNAEAQHVAATILRKALPNLPIELVIWADGGEKKIPSYSDLSCHVLVHKGRISTSLLKKWANASLILQIPGFYPHFQAFFQQIQGYSFHSLPICAHVGEYGSIDSDWFHPESGNMCMGLHALEKGLLLHSDLLSTDVLRKDPFYFAHLNTKRSYTIYLHALLKYNLHRTNNLKVVSCYLPSLHGENWSSYGLKEIVLPTGKISLSETGKTLTLECRENLSLSEVQKLFLTSENFVGCSDHTSFSNAVSLGRFFFYDAPSLYDVAAFHCSYYPSLLTYLECLSDHKTEPKALGNTIGELLQDPSLFQGMHKLLTLLKSDYLFNPTLVNLVKSKIYHHFYPSLKESEETLFKEFLKGAHSLEKMIYGRRT